MVFAAVPCSYAMGSGGSSYRDVTLKEVVDEVEKSLPELALKLRQLPEVLAGEKEKQRQEEKARARDTEKSTENKHNEEGVQKEKDSEKVKFTKEVSTIDKELREHWVRRVESKWTALSNAPYEVQADKAVVLAAVKVNGYALRFASSALRAQKDLVLVAVAQRGRALCFASEALRCDKDVVLCAAVEDGSALQFAMSELRGDRHLVFAACCSRSKHEENAAKMHREALRYASDELRSSANFVLELVAATGDELLVELALPSLKKTPGFRHRCKAAARRT